MYVCMYSICIAYPHYFENEKKSVEFGQLLQKSLHIDDDDVYEILAF